MTSFEACEYGDHYKKFKDTLQETKEEIFNSLKFLTNKQIFLNN